MADEAMMTDDMCWREFGDAMREAGKQRRADNRDNSAAILRDRGVSFESKNGGAHLIVQHGGRTFDFWPGTGKWTVRGSGNYSRGIFRLLRALGFNRQNTTQGADHDH